MVDAPDVKTRILDAAAQEFSREGFAGTKVDAIAKRAGVNKAGLYYHVGNKEKLYEAVLLHLFAQVAGTLEQAAAPETAPGAALGALTAALADLFTRLPVLPRIMALEMASGAVNMPQAALAEFRRIFAVTRGILARGQAAGLLVAAEPVFVHLTLVGSMIVYCLSEPLRLRFAAAGRDMGLDMERPVADMAAFLAQVMGRGLARTDGPGLLGGGGPCID
ncbi:TetR family transcriptional regulator [Desulfovibrio aerotolerans]|uniref:TetR family transcriptional regulator n=1 Tax=Solidesulfovibrio aerotolerans TaxID=295255 RepID=A0A7C9IU83_9BACT|nr:TetR/AcrR family transcriptional regulator [Solidesulfovibrio aerotolerans]MYL82183.1 TetR family transcriptional regulator [Solidesulfovibrio aerotolerans]